MSEKLQVTRISAEEAAHWDPSEISVALAPDSEAEVEPQSEFRLVECPWCGAVVKVYLHPSCYCLHTCGVCGGVLSVR